jgi:hypothetical protein
LPFFLLTYPVSSIKWRIMLKYQIMKVKISLLLR